MENKGIILIFGFVLAFLNVFDGFATIYGHLHNFIEELNPVMDSMLKTSPELFLLSKCLLSLFIVVISYLVYKKSKANFQKQFLFSLVGVSVMYTGIFFLHIFWLSMI
nr:DUF5658 family protein [Lysinibacillus timonensis]